MSFGGGLPAGTVTLKEGNKILRTATVSGGQATLDLERTLPPGTHRVTAVSSGDADFFGSVSQPVSFNI
jgi:hypothetical protein